MKFRFIGTYTNKHTGISILGHDFVGREATEVSDEAAARLMRHVEFELVGDLTEKAIEDIGRLMASTPDTRITPNFGTFEEPRETLSVATPKRRGRPRKVS